MVFTTIVVGHSQVPQHIQGDEHFRYIILRRPGGILQNLNSRPLNQVYSTPADLIVFFLGGNDIALFKNHPITLASRIRDHLLRLKDLAREVAFVSIESRIYPTGNRFNLTTREYTTVQTRVNNNLRRFCRNHHIRYINARNQVFVNNISHDGTHFNITATNYLISKIRNVAERCRQAITDGAE